MNDSVHRGPDLQSADACLPAPDRKVVSRDEDPNRPKTSSDRLAVARIALWAAAADLHPGEILHNGELKAQQRRRADRLDVKIDRGLALPNHGLDPLMTHPQ